MKKRILHLESEHGRSGVVEQLFQKHFEDISYTRVATREAYTEAVSKLAFDLVVVGAKNGGLLSDSPLNTESPVIYLASTDEERRRVQASIPGLWCAVLGSDADEFVLAARRALEFAGLKRSHEAMEGELAQAKNLLLKCQKSITIGRLLGSIAHEINNPLEAVSNLVYLAQRNSDNTESLLRALDLAERELQRVGEITKQMLTFHRDTKDVQVVRVTELLESVLSLYEARIAQHKIDVIRQYRSVGALAIYPGELRQILSNLIANAIDALPDGGHLIVRVQERRRSQPKLCITIADTGIGMSREESRRIGELFYTTKGESGTGLGMWVSRQLIAKHDGALHAYSSKRSGRSGTAFHLCFREPQAHFMTPSDSGHNALGTLPDSPGDEPGARFTDPNSTSDRKRA